MTLPNQWLTKDGRTLYIVDMSTDHLTKTVKFLRDRGNVTMHDFQAAMHGAASLQGEYAQMAAENEVANMKISRRLQLMETELARRAKLR